MADESIKFKSLPLAGQKITGGLLPDSQELLRQKSQLIQLKRRAEFAGPNNFYGYS